MEKSCIYIGEASVFLSLPAAFYDKHLKKKNLGTLTIRKKEVFSGQGGIILRDLEVYQDLLLVHTILRTSAAYQVTAS